MLWTNCFLLYSQVRALAASVHAAKWLQIFLACHPIIGVGVMQNVNTVWHHLLTHRSTSDFTHHQQKHEHYCSNLSRSLLILNIFMLALEHVSIDWVIINKKHVYMDNSASCLRGVTLSPPLRLSSNAARYQSDASCECKPMSCDWLRC